MILYGKCPNCSPNRCENRCENRLHRECIWVCLFVSFWFVWVWIEFKLFICTIPIRHPFVRQPLYYRRHWVILLKSRYAFTFPLRDLASSRRRKAKLHNTTISSPFFVDCNGNSLVYRSAVIGAIVNNATVREKFYCGTRSILPLANSSSNIGHRSNIHTLEEE